MPEQSADEQLMDVLYPPYEAERAYLAGVLQHPDANALLWRSTVEPVHLEHAEYAAILETMIAMRDAATPIHHLSLAEAIGPGPIEDAMWRLTDGAFWANPALVEFFAEQVMSRYRRRSVGYTGAALGEIAVSTPTAALDAQVDEAIATLLQKPAVARLTATSASLPDRMFGRREAEQVTPSPWPRLNRAIRGFRRGSLYTLSGDTGSGKSAVALQMAYALANAGTCLYFSMEMTEAELQDRLVAQQCGVSTRMVESQMFPEGPIRARVQQFVHAPTRIVFSEENQVSAAGVRRAALGVGSELSGIVIDQLSLMDLGDTKNRNLADVIARTTASLKVLALDLNVPVILLSQLNREAARAGRPTRHHLYGSSGIANDSAVILILHRDDPTIPQELTMIVDKNRFGEQGSFDLDWEGEFVRATDPTAIPSDI